MDYFEFMFYSFNYSYFYDYKLGGIMQGLYEDKVGKDNLFSPYYTFYYNF